jgi:adenylate cyclase
VAFDIDAALAKAEQDGLKLAIKGRLLAAVPFLVFYIAVGRSAAILLGVGALLVFMGLGLLHYWLIASGRESRWHRFALVGVDAAIICAIASLGPIGTGGDIPQIFVFRIYSVAYLLVFLAIATLSLSPALVLWTGVSQVIGLWGAFAWIVSGMERTVTWGDLPLNPTRAEFFALLFDPDFIGTGTRVVESMCLLVAAAILALAVNRARNLVRKEARAQAARENLARYVSPNLAERLSTAAEPFAVRRLQAGILFVDVVGFTRFAEQNDPETVIAFLRDFHGRMAKAVFDHEGTLDDFIGDEVTAVFGTPEPHADDAARALECAQDMRKSIAAWNLERAPSGFPPVKVGIGLHVGTVVAGNTGSENRLKFAVVGDAVNVASRLQAATRELGCEMVVSQIAMRAAHADPESGTQREVTLRGHAATVAVTIYN